MAVARKLPPIAIRHGGPGPGRYGLPTTIGIKDHDPTKLVNPAYSFGLKLHDQEYKLGPGPAHDVDTRFTRHGKDGTPHYSMSGKPVDTRSFNPPGPGQYAPEKFPYPRERYPPEYTMGGRRRFRTVDGTPAPNAYTLPGGIGHNLPDLKSAAAYTMNKRITRGSHLHDFANTPGPCMYDNIDTGLYKLRPPLYTMPGRTQLPSDSTLKPGPGAHWPEFVTINKPEPPKFSMGIRHSEYICPLIVDVPDEDD